MSYKTMIKTFLSDFDDDEIITHLEKGGYKVTYGSSDFDDVIHYMNRGNLSEALMEIKRLYPELKGLVDLYEKEKGA